MHVSLLLPASQQYPADHEKVTEQLYVFVHCVVF